MDAGKKTILIIDDSPLIVKRLTDLLNELPNIEWIKQAGNYDEGLQSIKDSNPDIVLLDINLPDKSGIDLLRFCREENIPLKIVIITNQANEFYRKLCIKLGADYFIDKSKDFEQITQVIAAIA